MTNLFLQAVFLVAAIACIDVFPGYADAFSGCEQDCLKCHKLDAGDAEKVLKPLFPDLVVESMGMAPSKGLWEVVFKANGKKNIVYIDFSLQNVIAGRIIQVKTKNDLTLDRMIEINRVDFSLIPLENSLVMGDRHARHKVVVFSDPD